MPRLVWIIAGVLTTIVLISVLGLSSWIKSQQLREIRLELEQAGGANEAWPRQPKLSPGWMRPRTRSRN
jgi:hypothetical protein